MKFDQNCDCRYNLVGEIRIGPKSTIEFGLLGVSTIVVVVVKPLADCFLSKIRSAAKIQTPDLPIAMLMEIPLDQGDPLVIFSLS